MIAPPPQQKPELLPLSFRHRLDAVVAAAGGHMDY